MATCAICGGTFESRDVVRFDGRDFCERCKDSPAFAQIVSGKATVPQVAGPTPKWPFYVGAGCLVACLGLSLLGALGVSRAKKDLTAGLGAVNDRSCGDELREMYVSAAAYRQEKGALPPGIADLERWEAAGEAPDEALWGCPGSVVDLMAEEDDARFEDAFRASYRGFEPGLGDEPDEPLVWDASPRNHGGRGRSVLFGSGAVRFLPEKEFHELMAKHGR